MRATGPSFGLATCTRVRLHRHVPDMACVRAEYCGMPELSSACGAGGDLVPDGGDLTEPGDGRVVEQVIQRLLDQVTRGVRGGGGRQLGRLAPRPVPGSAGKPAPAPGPAAAA